MYRINFIHLLMIYIFIDVGDFRQEMERQHAPSDSRQTMRSGTDATRRPSKKPSRFSFWKSMSNMLPAWLFRPGRFWMILYQAHNEFEADWVSDSPRLRCTALAHLLMWNTLHLIC